VTERRSIVVEVVYARPDRQDLVALTLPEGATVADALEAVADRTPFAALDLARMPVGVFGDRVDHARELAHGDRVELYRPLVIDPREARRRRAAARSG
jgi:putative ubiquitin-RnfH superfamily antitoxin RatB of RatAB toxin-antitoxin module